MDKIIFVSGEFEPVDFTAVNSELEKGWNVKSIIPQIVTSEYTHYGGFVVVLNDGKNGMII
jgi:hypothetical protein